MSDEASVGRSCPWCSAAAPDEATTCPACGAALAQRESIGGVRIPGVTAVDPALEAIANQPMRIPGPSASHGIANTAIVGVMIGGPIGLAAVGGVAAVAAAEYAGTGRTRTGSPEHLEDVGRPSEVALLALERLATTEPDGVGEPAASPDPWRDLPPGEPPDPWRDEPGRGGT